MQPNYAGSSAFGSGAGIGAPTTGWTFVQNSPLIFCSPGPRSSCTPGQGNIVPTVAGSLWIVYTQTGTCNPNCTPDHLTITNVTGGGGTWVHCPNCATSNPSGFSVDAWYNLHGNAGTTNITITMSGTSGNVYGATFVELLPPPGATASFDTSGVATPSSCTTCTGVTLSNPTATDVIFTNTGGSTQTNWESWSAPYLTDFNGGGTCLNCTSGAAPTVSYFSTSNPELFAIAFKSSAGFFTPTPKQYAVVNFTAPNLSSACGTSTPCSFTIPATGTNNLLFVESGSEIGSFISAISDNATGGSNVWTIPASCQIHQTVQGQNNASSCAWVLSSKPGATSLTITMTGNGSTGFAVWEISTTIGAFVLDVLATTLNGPAGGPGGFYFSGQPLTLSGQNDVVFQLAWSVGGSLGPNYFAQPFIRNQGGGTGIGVGPANYFFAANVASTVLTDSGPTPPTPTWISPVSAQPSFVIGAAFQAIPQVITAADCNSSSVTTALSQVVSDGATVIIPAGSCTWSSTVSYTANHSLTIQGQTTVTGTCAPGGTCTATDNTTITNSTGSAALHVTSVSGKSVRVTGLTFAQGTGAQQFVGNLFIDGGSQSVRVDHNHFLHANIVDLTLQGNSTAGNLYGVVDHNMFNTGGSNEDALRVEHYNWNGSVNMVGYGQGGGEGSWTDSAHWGSNQFVFIENNFFAFDGANTTHAFAFDIDAGGGRVVFRYNNVTPNMALQTHGTGSGDPNFRGSRAIEMYGNNFAYVATTNTFQAFEWESGNAYIWDNSWSNYTQMVQLDYVRTTNATYSQSATPNGWGYCLSSPLGGVPGPSPWDVSGSGPCVDQTGRGAGDLVHGTFPNKVDTVTNTITWPNQAAEPSYLWGNTLSNVPHYVVHFASGNIHENTDYFTERPNIDNSATFDGTQGVGCGPSAGVGCSNPVAQPSTCTAGVGYWNPALNTLFQCGSSNNWVAFYTPYTYPHPLDV